MLISNEIIIRFNYWPIQRQVVVLMEMAHIHQIKLVPFEQQPKMVMFFKNGQKTGHKSQPMPIIVSQLQATEI